MPELTHAQAWAFYDRFGSRQDLQRLYEDAALERLLANATLRQAHAVGEFGCGTGRLAERMLDELLPLDATYLGYDVSLTMIELARARLARFGPRACVAQTDGSPALPLADSTCDSIRLDVRVRPPIVGRHLVGGCQPVELTALIGPRFLTAYCRQSSTPRLCELERGSVVVFGSRVQGVFVCDTVLVVDEAVPHDRSTYEEHHRLSFGRGMAGDN